MVDDKSRGWEIHVEGNSPTVLKESRLDEYPVVRDTRGFECASGDWIEHEWEGVPVFELLEAADVPADTTHVQLESVDGYRSCVRLADLEDAIVAVDGGDGGVPRLISPQTVGPRNIKQLAYIRPKSLTPEDKRERYEKLPIENK